LYRTADQQPAIKIDNVIFIAHHRNDLYCVEWGVKLYSLTHSLAAQYL